MVAPATRPLRVFLDESGDLGWSLGSSQHLVIGTVCTRSRRRLGRLLKRFKEAFGIPLNAELKSFDAGPSARHYLLKMLASDRQCYCRAIVVYKPNVKVHLRREPNLLYNYATGLLLVPHIKGLSSVVLSVDPREQKVSAPRRFDEYLRTELYAEHESDVDLQIHRPESSVSPGIQAADYLCNAIFRHFERGETRCYSAIRGKLELHRLYFP
jgi:hypothetical protein